MMKYLYCSKNGVSLLIGIGLIAVILFFSLLSSNVVVSSIRQSANVNSANDAYYAAEGALEQALLINANGGVAFNAESGLMDVDGNTQASYIIQGRVPDDRKYGDVSDFKDFYGIPSPGGGNAGTNCDPVNAYYDKYFSYSYKDYKGDELTEDQTDPAEHPCNWGILREGESISIPLYATDYDGTILNPFDLNLSDLRVRVRTPCKYGNEMCPENGDFRYDLDDENGDAFYACDGSKQRCGDTIIAWTINGANITGDKVFYLEPYTEIDAFLNRDNSNSEIYESLINKNGYNPSVCGLYCVLKGNAQKGVDLVTEQDGTIKEFLWNTGTNFTRADDERINKPVLKLSVIHSLADADNAGASVPYIEYQVLTDADKNPANNVQTITAEGFSNEFKQTLEVKVPNESGILEYVIQQ